MAKRFRRFEDSDCPEPADIDVDTKYTLCTIYYMIMPALLVMAFLEDASTVTQPSSAPATLHPPSTQPASVPVIWRATLDAPISTDRPDFTESTATIPRGHFQLEGGYSFTRDEQNGHRTRDQTLPELLLRAGLTDDLELRIGGVGLSLTEDVYRAPNRAGRSRVFREHNDGGTDMSVGAKVRILTHRGLIPDFSLIAGVGLPTGDSGKSSGDVDPEVKLLWGYELTDRVALSGNFNFAMPSDEIGRFVQTAASVSLGYSLTDWLGAFVEYYGFFPDERRGDGAHYVNGGFAFQLTENVQFDVRLGAGLNDAADDFFTGVGFAFRF